MLNVLVTADLPCVSVPQVVDPLNVAGDAAMKPLFPPVRVHVNVKSRASSVVPAGLPDRFTGVTVTVPPAPPDVVVNVIEADAVSGELVSAAFDRLTALKVSVVDVTVTTALGGPANAGVAAAIAHAAPKAASRNFIGRLPRSCLRSASGRRSRA
jgi:hypothetical protein